MALEQFKQISRAEQARLGLPEGFKLFTPYPFGSMNQQDSRQGMPDPEFFLRENFIKIGAGNLRALWDVGTPIFTALGGLTIVSFYFYNIGLVNYAIVFLSDGTAVQVNYSTLVQTVVSNTPGTFYNGKNLPACRQWGTQYLLISNNDTLNDYWVWDGSVLYSAGSIGPVITLTSGGSGYTSTPTITAFGGSGSGATFLPTVVNGSVVSIIPTNPGSGYSPGDIVQLEFSGGGSDSGAILTAVLAPSAVGSVELLAGGTGYTGAPTVVFSGGGGGSGATAVAVVSGGEVTGVTVTAGGTGYTSTPSVSFTGGGGSGATAIAVLTPGVVAGVGVSFGGSGYTSTPLLNIVGGGGSGATATAIVTSGVITSVTLTATGSGYTSAPAVEIVPGANNAASATAVIMPFGVSGAAMETFQARVWLVNPTAKGTVQNGGTELLSAPGSFTDFSTSTGGLIYNSSDAYLRAQYTAVRQSNGYLYDFGDSSVSVISNVQTTLNSTTNNVTTTFNYQNTDPQIGTSWRDACSDYSRTILFANPIGVYGLYGGAVQKISEKMDRVFTSAIFPPTHGALLPSSAVANIFNKKAYFLLMTVTDPDTFALRNVMLGWDEKEWFLASQSSALIYIGTQEVNSNLKAWGTDGNSLFPLFNQPSSNLTKKLSTKLYGADSAFIQKESYVFFIQGQDLSTGQGGLNFGVTVDNEFSSYELPVTCSFASPPPAYSLFSSRTLDVPGVNLGLTISSTSPDFSVNFLGLGYIDIGAVLGSSGLVET